MRSYIMETFDLWFDEGDGYADVQTEYETYEEALNEAKRRAEENGRTYFIKATIAVIGAPKEITVEEYEYV